MVSQKKSIDTVAIIGGGPTGAALAFHLCKAGKKVVLYERRTRPPVTVGESLVPATIPFIKELGIEDEVREYSTFKPGATFTFNQQDTLSFEFAEVRKATTHYSYNVPRDKFDLSIERVAEKTGALIVREAARVERGEGERVRLSEKSLAATEGFLREQPDLIVDASGRVRLLPNLLDLPFVPGKRRDTALFAHCKGVAQFIEGNVHTDILDHGWAWRIPLPGRVSCGLVMDSDHIRSFGRSTDEQFDNYVKQDSVIGKWWGADCERITPVLKFSNYQLRSERGYGDGWALCGDSFGFVDPVFSSGLLLSFDSARQLANAIIAGGGAAEMQAYEAHVMNHLANWHQTIDHFYTGRLFTLFEVGERVSQTWIGRMMEFHFKKHLPRVFTGEATTRRYSVWLLDFMCRRGLMGTDPTPLMVR